MKDKRGTAADAVTRNVGSAFVRRPVFFVLCVMLLAPAIALAQVGNDPTRPPANLGGSVDTDADAGGGMTLQSVIISPTNKAAIISGVMVKLGEKYGDAVLVKVTENEVVLKSGTTSQVLKLHPGVEKREPASATPERGARRGKTRSPAPTADGGGASPR
jgi:MSHA biogenesis protein MshK